MKTVILAGGYGTRISEESHLRPKPLIEIGGKPILWHIMKIYFHHQFQDFIVCMGYKGASIKEYFSNYSLHESSTVSFDFKNGNKDLAYAHPLESWKVTLVETGLDTMTGGRIKKIQKHVGNSTFMLTYGDGVSDIDIEKLVQFHKSHRKLATVTAVQPGGRFGSLQLGEKDRVIGFQEKPKLDGNWINGGFFVLEPGVFDYIRGDIDRCIFENEPLEALAQDGQLVAYKHTGFWKPMDTTRDKGQLEQLWSSGEAPWKIW